ncbi:MAG TPA: hypothetical protein VFP46_01145, partial [Candidatus Paceibacterota bacterium]|nr:hypothetical protein [Candidatus Paceibacterota bacterium]
MVRKVLVGFLFVLIVVAGGAAFTRGTARAQDLTPEERAALQAQLDELQKEIAEQQQIIADTQNKKKSLQGDVTLLNAQIKAAQAKIDAKNILIRQLSAQIAQKNVVIRQLSDRIDRGHEALASLLRQEAQLDSTSVVVVALSGKNLSSFFADLDAFVSIKSDLQALFNDIRHAKDQTEKEKADLAAAQDKTLDAKYEIEGQKQQITTNKTQKQQLLAITVNQEAQYQKVLAERQARAAAIRAALFPLRDAAPIQFEDALNFAKEAQAKTGVRPAFILAILTQESNLGKNVGQCYLTDPSTGAGTTKSGATSFPNVMAPSRDVPPFVDLGRRLGYDPLRQVVSCPIPSAGGWGGAMGPAQFIPSTWSLYESRTASVTGHSVPNPWSAEDAIAAMSLYLSDLGAGAGGYTAEFRAAAKYYAGASWNTRAGRGYGNSVMALAASIQSNIDFLAS